MKVIKIDKQQWAEGFETLSQSYRLAGPKADGGFHHFKRLGPGELPDLDAFNTRLSPKFLIYPQSEVMFEYHLDEGREDHHLLKEPEPAGERAPLAVVGIRPCDADAFLLVKRNFDTPDYKDPYWIRAYETTTLVGLACDNPCSSCFCTTAGSGPFSESGLDVLLVDRGDHFLARVITEKGDRFISAAGWNLEAEGAETVIEAARAEAEAGIRSEIATDRLAAKVTTELYDAPFWEEVAFACINCGTCTYLCPTCWCFDIQDETHGKAGVRMRNWDSCMFPLFTLHGSGHNPRNQKMPRVRQRFMHKLKYYVDKYGDGIQCVGCGRCVQFCPVNIDIRKVCNQMNAYGSETVCEIPTN